MTVSRDQIERIRHEVERSQVVIGTLKDDLVDHLCCEVEQKLESGKSFEECLTLAVLELAPNGLLRIQHETNFLLNSKKMTHMKKAIYLIGLLSTMSCSVGFIFRTLHFPGGNQLLSFGFLGFVLLYLPLSTWSYFQVNLSKPFLEKLKIVFGIGSGAVAGLGVLFKVLHLPGADQCLLFGGLWFSFLYLPLLFYSMYKNSVNRHESSNNGLIS